MTVLLAVVYVVVILGVAGTLNDRRIALMHTNGCGKVAFFYNHIPQVGEIARASFARYPDGRQPKFGDMPYCGHCGQPLSARDCTINHFRRVW